MLSTIVIATLLVSSVSLIGGVFLLWRNLLTQRVIPYLVSFAAGVILTTAFFDLLPEALHEGGESMNIFVPTFAGIILFFFLERFLLWFHHHDESHGEEPSSSLILIGDSFHNFIDGVVIAAAFLTDPALGVATTIAIAAHEIPHEIADFTILIHSGMSKMKALLLNFFSSLIAVLGAVGGYFFLNALEYWLPLSLAFSAGMFIYIACSDLIPDMHKDFKKQKGWVQSLPFIVGIILMYASITFLRHE